MTTDAEASDAAMTGLDHAVPVAENYRRFARREASSRSPAYEALALFVAGDGPVLEFLATLPPEKRQPNLLFAAARYLLDAVPDADALSRLVSGRAADLRAVMLARRTQTNEVARCATLIPALCRLPQPLALVEVGASAGLCLLADRYSYDYGGRLVPGADPAAPTLRCRVEGPVPAVTTVPTVAWRRGVDLNPLDPADEADVHWLECLIWPGEEGRVERLHAAIAAARRHPVTVERGDLLDALPSLVAGAPAGSNVVVVNSVVLAYLEPPMRKQFARLVRTLGVHWLSNEAPGVLPGLESRASSGGMLLVEDGERVLAESDGHGSWLRWMADR